MVFLSYGASIGIVFSLLGLFIFTNLGLMLGIKINSGPKSYYNKQNFIKKLLLLNNPNIPSKFFVIMTYVNYIMYGLVIIAFICHMAIYNQTSSLVFQHLAGLNGIVYSIFVFSGVV